VASTGIISENRREVRKVVSIKEALGPSTILQGPKQTFVGKLFAEDEQERASYIAKGLEGLTIQEAADLLDSL